MSRMLLKGGRVIDPSSATPDLVRDIAVHDGRIAEPDAAAAYDQTLDLAGSVVMAGGIDLHTHIGGGKVNLARMLMAEDHRERGNPIALPANALELASCGGCAPGTLATGYRYVEMGYTAGFEPAMVPSNARHAHMEMGDVPVLDHGAYVMLGNDELFLQLLAEGGPEMRNFAQIRDYTAWTIHASKAMGVKVVNPAGISAFKFNQRKLDVDEKHVHWQVTPRQVVHSLARALKELGVPHPLHIHGSNLGVAGNIQSTLDTIAALEGLPAHLTHIQFHSYGTEGPKKFSSAALQLVEAVNANPQISIDVGQILFGQTVTASGDSMKQYGNHRHASPDKWVVMDIECDSGCGVVPFKYKDKNFVNALQWAIGLELFLRVNDPWRIFLTTDHPNGAPFTSYPHLIRLLMDRGFRNSKLDEINAEAAAHSQLRSLEREYSLYEIAIMTRAAPARSLGLNDRGHLGVGAAADIVVYRDDADREAMFERPEYVFKDGELIVRDGQVVKVVNGAVHAVKPEYDKGIEKPLKDYFDRYMTMKMENVRVSDEELCTCGASRLIPHQCGGRKA